MIKRYDIFKQKESRGLIETQTKRNHNQYRATIVSIIIFWPEKIYLQGNFEAF